MGPDPAVATDHAKGADAASPRILIIVGRARQQLYETLRQEYAEYPDVRVILDRRAGEDPARQPPGAERRARPEVDEQVRRIGLAIVHL
jgi:hypothetical protein